VANAIMAHLVAFYPDKDGSLEVARALTDGGAAYLEVQFPFSDPTADGPVIQRACSRALAAGFTMDAGFQLLCRMCRLSKAPVFVMSYANPIVRRGAADFVRRCREAGARGIIAPDLPVDSDEGLYAEGRKAGLEVVPVLAPTMPDERLSMIAAAGTGYLYAALRKGITGEDTAIADDNLLFLKKAAGSGSKILAGFGISRRGQVEALTPHVHAVVIGSALVRATAEAAGNGASGGNGKSPYKAVRAAIEALV
jgi:tryptophan synthase alpha chain